MTAAIFILFAASCSGDKDSAGLEFMPDMYRSAAIEPYVDFGEIREKTNEDLKMKLSAMVPPRGTVPYYGTDSAKVAINLPYFRLPNKSFKLTHGLYDSDLSSEDEYGNAAMDINPLKLTQDNKDILFKRGKYLYSSKCQHCHGESGDGNGPMVASGAYVGVPDYKNLNISDGQMFYSIYYGKGTMGAHGPILNKEEIWTLVHYVRKFQDANYGTGETTEVTVADTVVNNM